MPASSPSDGFDVVVLALSARALARSARRAGLSALAIDLFADADTREHASLAVRAPAGARGAFDGPALLAALGDHARDGLPVVFGAGFEDATGLMAEIGRRNPIAGAAPGTVARLKNPSELASLLEDLAIPHPEIRTERSLPGLAGTDPAGWVSKRAAASGGAHIRDRPARGRRRYLQRRVEGRSLSALFLADGRNAAIVGFSEQWADPTPRAPFRYGGAVGPVFPPAPLAGRVAAALGRIVEATALVGLASADLVVPDDGADFWLIEINPRPGASLDVFDRAETPPLLALHLDACQGRLPRAIPLPGAAQAAAVVYARRRVDPASLRRPVWTADWPACDDTVPAGAPVCTVLAAGASPNAARVLLVERRSALLQSLTAASTAVRTTVTAPS